MAHFNYLAPELQDDLRKTAEAIVAPGKGILAADESEGIKPINQSLDFLI